MAVHRCKYQREIPERIHYHETRYPSIPQGKQDVLDKYSLYSKVWMMSNWDGSLGKTVLLPP